MDTGLYTISAYLQKKLLFRPVRLDEDHPYVFDAPFDEHFLPTPDGAVLNALLFPSKLQISRGVVLYFHGNKGNLQRWGAMHRDFTERGFDFFVPDYRGYGKSTGEPSERTYFEDARLVYDWLRAHYAADRIMLYGRSLGSGMASYLGAHIRARSVVLETPFDNIKGLFSEYFRQHELLLKPAFQFPNDRHLRQTALPVLIFHGLRDRVVPYASAVRLREYLKPGDQFVTIPDGNHNNLREFAQYQENLESWLSRVV